MATVSDLNPIQFWPTGTESYNEKAICGVYSECFCQLFVSGDPITIQLSSPNGGQFELRLLDDSVLQDSIDFVEVTDKVYEADTNLSTATITMVNGRVQSATFLFDSVTLNVASSATIGAGDFDAFHGAVSGYAVTDDVVTYVDVNCSDLSGGVLLNYSLWDAAKSSSVNITPIPITRNGTYKLTKAGTSITPAYIEIILDNGTSGTVSSWSVEPIDTSQKQLKIFNASQIEALAGFENRGTDDATWTITTNLTTTTTGLETTNYAVGEWATFSDSAGTIHTIDYNIEEISGNGGDNLTFYIMDINYNVIGTSATIASFGGTRVQGTASITTYADGAFVACIYTGFNAIFHIYTLVGDTGEELYHSDCIKILEDDDCTKLLTYDNTTDFDGMVFETSGSPSGGPFSVRVPAIFYKENNPEEHEDHELSNGVIVTLRQKIQQKRLLELGYMPNYMHRKIQKVLMCDSVLIDGEYWKKRDEYEAENINRYGLKRGQVWLTDYDSVKKNTP